MASVGPQALMSSRLHVFDSDLAVLLIVSVASSEAVSRAVPVLAADHSVASGDDNGGQPVPRF